MRPNWGVVAYLAALGAALVAVVVLATTTAVLWLAGSIADRPVPRLDAWLLGATVVALGILPWPGVLALARPMFRPGKLGSFRVARKPVGSVAVALTALDEEPAITQVVSDFVATPGVGSVTVVDNGSRDRTGDLASAAGARVVREERRGYGHACMRALAEGMTSGHEATVLCEADGTFSAEDIGKLVEYLKHADLVIGSRTHQALLNGNSQLNSFFIVGNVFIAKLLQLRYWDWGMGGGVRLTDAGCTYRAIRTGALQQILPALEIGGHHFGPHMVMVALEHGLRVVEVPVTFSKRVGISKGGNGSWRKGFEVGMSMIWHIMTYRVRRSVEVAGSSMEASSHVVSR